ncbi:hypothetical protein LC593_33015 [Nostoc sp. CHAB 5844]|nr:hypothetical protein [Nostoc sp. CHAB 5844]
MHQATEVAATWTKPACAGFKALILRAFRVGGLRLYSQATALGGFPDLKQVVREFHSSGLGARYEY